MNAPNVFRRAFDRTLPAAGDAARWLDRICTGEAVEPDTMFAMQVCLEEIFSNIVRHGAPAASSPSQVILTLEFGRREIELTVADDGRPFDVSEAPAQKVSKPIEEVTPGGLGVLLAKTYANRLTYKREDGQNIVTAEFSRTP